jgi:hypothetical protein
MGSRKFFYAVTLAACSFSFARVLLRRCFHLYLLLILPRFLQIGLLVFHVYPSTPFIFVLLSSFPPSPPSPPSPFHTRTAQVHASLVSTLLSLMDGMHTAGRVFVLAATNRVDSIDAALRRSGRCAEHARFLWEVGVLTRRYFYSRFFVSGFTRRFFVLAWTRRFFVLGFDSPIFCFLEFLDADFLFVCAKTTRKPFKTQNNLLTLHQK